MKQSAIVVMPADEVLLRRRKQQFFATPTALGRQTEYGS
jgi:hypothetical protein